MNLFIALGSLCAQITGTVLDEKGNPIESVTVANLRSGMHTHTNDAGYFVLSNTISGDSVKVSRNSYQSRILIYTGGTTINEIRLIDANVQLADVVVNSGI